ncbi:MAG: glutamate--tRNA ligase [Bacteroidia bacterium]|nr:glutamate--tRNA ligase [Bacteroidia bacterium]
MSKVRVRFAPSPTGPLHIGGVRTALFNYLFAKQNGGDMILRIEDTDQQRFVPGAEQYIVEALTWAGIKFDEGTHVGGPFQPYRQSERKDMYREFADQLLESNHAYYAFDTAEELDAMREKLKAGGMAPQYDAVSRMSMVNSLTLSEDEVKRRLEAGDPYVIRIKLPRKEEVRFHDLIRGWVVVQTAAMDDKVLFKSDGMPTYHLANVVDDYKMKITHVIRGEEWLPSAPLHVMLYKYLGWEEHMPSFAHLPLILKPDGNGKLSKRDGDRLGFPVFALEWKDPATGEISSGYREKGYEPEAVINMLALLGWHTSDNREIFNMDELIALFSIEKISKNGAKFDPEKAKGFNHQHLMLKDNRELAQDIMPQIQALGFDSSMEYLTEIVGLVKEKVTFKNEIPERCAYFFKAPTEYDAQVIAKKWNAQVAGFLNEFADKLSEMSSNSVIEVETFFKSEAQAQNINPGSLMQPLRVCLSGEAGGPPLFEMLVLIGVEESAKRIKQAVNAIATTA